MSPGRRALPKSRRRRETNEQVSLAECAPTHEHDGRTYSHNRLRQRLLVVVMHYKRLTLPRSTRDGGKRQGMIEIFNSHDLTPTIFCFATRYHSAETPGRSCI